MMNRKSKLLSLLLALCILAAVFPALPSAMAADGETAAPPATAVTYEDVLAGLADPYDYFGPLDENSVPAAVGYENAVERLHVARMYDEEGDSLHNVIFKNADGSRTQYLFDYPVKYVTETGEIADIRLDVVRDAQTAGAFRTAANSVVTTFSPYLSDGILLQSGGVSLRLIPAGASPAPSASSAFSAAPAAQRLDAGTVAYAVDDKTDYEYTLTYTGFKEDIVVSEYTGQTEYTFTLLTNGLTLTQRDGSYYLTDDDGAVKATIGDILIFTADERNNALGTLTHETVQDKQAYTLTIHLDDEYLRDENTAYPIRIDPTIEITSAAGAIEDVTLNSLSGSDGDSWSLTIGKRATYGVSRVLMRFPGLSLSAIPSADKITSASVELRDLMCEDEAMMVYCYVFTGNSWTESTANWSNVNPDSYTTLLSSRTVSYSNGASQPSAHRYAFNITNAVKGWKTGNYIQSKGLLFKAPASVENGSTYIKKTFSSYNRSTYKPSLTVNYDVGESQILANGTYYLNGKEGGGYLRYASGAASAKSGLISSLGNSVRWELQSVDGGYVLRSRSDMTKYLAVPSSTASTSVTVETVSESALPSRCIWTISGASGGCFVKSAYNGKYLYSYGTALNMSSTTGTSGSAAYNARVWRLASTSYYGTANSSASNHELSSFSMSNATISLGEPINPKMTTDISSPLWDSPSDFTYSSNANYICDSRTGTLIGASSGSCSVVATHKVTGQTASFTVTVEDSLLKDSCLVGGTKYLKYSVGNNSSVLSGNVTWASSDLSVATVNSSGIVTGINTGYAFISAKNSSGKIILQCEFQVSSPHTEKLATFSYNETQYLYCPSTYLNQWTQNLDEAFELKVDIIYCLRSYYRLPEAQHPDGVQLKNILKDNVNLTIDADAALWLFNECYLGYRGLYNPEYLNNLRKQYFNYLKEITAFCAFSMAGNLDPTKTLSNCNGYDDLVYDLSKEWGHNESSSNVMLGSMGYQGKYYFVEAEKYGYRYFYSPNYNQFNNKYGADFVRSVNVRYLQRCINSNCTFYFCSDPTTAKITSSLHMEYSYLLNYYKNLWGEVYLISESGLWFFSRTP